jgi:hypothetical protein
LDDPRLLATEFTVAEDAAEQVEGGVGHAAILAGMERWPSRESTLTYSDFSELGRSRKRTNPAVAGLV